MRWLFAYGIGGWYGMVSNLPLWPLQLRWNGGGVRLSVGVPASSLVPGLYGLRLQSSDVMAGYILSS